MQWTTNRSAKLVFNSERRLAAKLSGRIWITETVGAGLLHIAARVKRVVIVKPKRRSVILVRAATRDGVENGAGVASVLRNELVRHQSHFLDRVRFIQRDSRSGNSVVVVVLTIDHDVVGTYAAAVGGQVCDLRDYPVHVVQLDD